jgi:flavorubredoxin
MWKSTEKMARAIEEGVRQSGVKVISLCLSSCGRSEVADEILDAAGLIVGSPTLNNNLFPSLADMLAYLKGLRFRTPYAAVFGSYGWSGEAINQAKEQLTAMGSEIVGEVKTLYRPGAEILQTCFDLGRATAKKVDEYISR